MKKLLKILGIIVGALVLVIIVFLLFVNFRTQPTYEVEAPIKRIEITEAKVLEGARIARMMCAQCHMGENGTLSGTLMEDAPQFGKIYSKNITKHKDGIADYTDGELWYLLRTGIDRTGHYTPPYMPKYPNLADEDMEAIIAFLRSDHELVSPTAGKQPESELSFLSKFLLVVAFEPLPYREARIEMPDSNDRVAFGEYIATAKFDCYQCHSADFATNDPMIPSNSQGFMGGGNTLSDLKGNPIKSSNLTMDEETGIGKWTEEEFVTAVRSGKRPEGPATRYPMMPYALLTKDEVSAVYSYLKTLPEIHNPNDH